MPQKAKIKNNSGLSLINVLVGITIIIIAGLGLWNLFNFSLQILGENKFRTLAAALANEKIEIIRNLPYDQIGTQAGIPPGPLPQTEAVTRNNAQFTVTTAVFYVDDPYDNLVPQDLLGADYKKIKVSIDWPGRKFGDPVDFYAFVSPKGVETEDQGGTLRLIVFNASGEPVPAANVQIINNTLNPPINTSSVTDQSGILLVPGSPATEDKSYEIIATKNGYTAEKTYPETDELMPTKSHAQVLEDQITEKSFTIDLISTFNIFTIGKDYPSNWKINTASTSAEQINPSVCVDQNNYYYFVWQDTKDTGAYRLYAQKYSSSRVAQWSEDKRIVTANNQINPRIAANGSDIYIVWNDNREGNQDSYLIKLDANGNELWSSDKKMGSLNQSDDQTYPALAVSPVSGAAFIAFQENSGALDNWDIYLYKYDSSGNPDPLLPNALKVNDDATDKNQTNPQIAFYNDVQNDDQIIYIVWQDFRNDNWDIYAHKYNATGTPLWSNNLKINTDISSFSQTLPQISVASQGAIYIVWQDNRNGNYDIYLHKYNKDGSPVWANEIKVNQNVDTADQTEPALALDNADELFVSWTDERYADTHSKDIYAQKIDSSGLPLWSSDELIVFGDETKSPQEKSKVAGDTSGFAVFTWQDSRYEDTDTDIFAARFKSPGTIIPSPNVPLTVKGTKRIYETPVILKHDNNFTTNSNGNLTLTNIEWDAYIIEPQSTSTYTLISSNPPQPIIINPNETIDMELNVE